MEGHPDCAGIAAAAQAIVEAAQQVNSDVVIACTRKTLPGTRALSIKAIRSGGAVPHHLGLSETIIVFAQHRTFTIAIARQMFQEILRLIAELRSQPPPALARDVRCHAFKSNRQKECVQMPGKWPDQTLDQALGLPEVLVAVSTSRLSCKRAGKREH